MVGPRSCTAHASALASATELTSQGGARRKQLGPGGARHRRRCRTQLSWASASSPPLGPETDWREKAKPIKPGSTYPAKEFCSNCGLCDTYYVAHVKEACAFLGDGMSDVERLEEEVHGRPRDLTSDDLHYGVHTEMIYAKCWSRVLWRLW